MHMYYYYYFNCLAVDDALHAILVKVVKTDEAAASGPTSSKQASPNEASVAGILSTNWQRLEQ